jgi:hypothetical protein
MQLESLAILGLCQELGIAGEGNRIKTTIEMPAYAWADMLWQLYHGCWSLRIVFRVL